MRGLEVCAWGGSQGWARAGGDGLLRAFRAPERSTLWLANFTPRDLHRTRCSVCYSAISLPRREGWIVISIGAHNLRFSQSKMKDSSFNLPGFSWNLFDEVSAFLDFFAWIQLFHQAPVSFLMSLPGSALLAALCRGPGRLKYRYGEVPKDT